MKHDELKPFIYNPMINGYRGTLHFKVAVSAGHAMNRGEEQRRYLRPVFEACNLIQKRTFLHDPIQEIHQFKVGALVGMPIDFNKVEARKDLLEGAREIYEKEKKTPRQQEGSTLILILN